MKLNKDGFFDIKSDNIFKYDEMLLFNIQELLKRQMVDKPEVKPIENTVDYDNMSRDELKVLAKGKVKGKWITFDEEKLRQAVKEAYK